MNTHLHWKKLFWTQRRNFRESNRTFVNLNLNYMKDNKSFITSPCGISSTAALDLWVFYISNPIRVSYSLKKSAHTHTQFSLSLSRTPVRSHLRPAATTCFRHRPLPPIKIKYQGFVWGLERKVRVRVFLFVLWSHHLHLSFLAIFWYVKLLKPVLLILLYLNPIIKHVD